MRTLRAAFRLARVGVHLVYGAATVAAAFPSASRHVRLRLKQRWSRQLLGMLGVRVDSGEADFGHGSLLVANHISWLDIFVINAVHPAAFVAKDDVHSWPLIGWLCARTETIFIERGNRRAARAIGQQVAALLAAGVRVAVFPEGTTSKGDRVLPFHGALLQGAVDAGVAVRPLALRYLTPFGQPSHAPAYCGDTTLPQSLWRIAAEPELLAVCRSLAPVEAQGRDRRELAAACESSVRDALATYTEAARDFGDADC